jgi:predicted phage replisome organizer
MISWIKLDINILDDAKIKIIRSHPDGNAIVVLWIGLLCLAMKSQRPGIIEISNALPYTIDDLSNLFNIDKKTCELGLMLFEKYKMVDLLEDGTVEIINFSKHQKLEDIERKRELTRVRTIKYREGLRICDAPVTRHGVTVTLTDLDLVQRFVITVTFNLYPIPR